MKILRFGSLLSMLIIPLFLTTQTVQAQSLGTPKKVSEHLMKLNLAIADLSVMSEAPDTSSQVDVILASTSSSTNAERNREIVNRKWARAVNYVDETYGPNAADKFQAIGQRINRHLKQKFGEPKAAKIEKEFFLLFQKKFISPS